MAVAKVSAFGLIGILFALFLTVTIKATAMQEVKSTYREPVITYSRGVKTVLDLPMCMADMACNLIHKRFFFAPVVLRLCRCLDKSDCPSDWQESGDEHTMHVNLRSQLKFCGQVTKLPTCKQKTAMALTARIEQNDHTEYQFVTTHCHCPKMRYLDRSDLVVQQLGNSSTVTTHTYKCKHLIKCQTDDFCGHITANNYETYHVCSCPQQHMCLMKDRKRFHVIEAMYEGLAFRGHCVPNNVNLAVN